jgi:hypothetical protein
MITNFELELQLNQATTSNLDFKITFHLNPKFVITWTYVQLLWKTLLSKLINVNKINEKCFYAMENIPWLKPNPTTPNFSLLLLLFDDLVH